MSSSGIDIQVRGASPADAVQINQLSQELGYLYPPEKVAARIERILKQTKDVILVAERDGALVGYIHGTPYELLFDDPLVNILALVVQSAYRSMGIGGLLLSALEHWAHENDYAGIRLVSGSDRVDAHRFYLNHGYQFNKDQKSFSKRI